MNFGRTVFAQILDHVDHNEFNAIVRRHSLSSRKLPFSHWEHFAVLAFALLTSSESLRTIEHCLNALGPRLYHSGIHSKVSRSTLAHANEHRPWRIYQDLALGLIRRAQNLYHDDRLFSDLDAALYAFDSTIIELCLKLFPWARAANHLDTSAGIKLHTLLDVQSNIPVFTRVSEANLGDLAALKDLAFEPGAFYMLDRGYTGFATLRQIDTAGTFFVIRAKHNLRFRRVYSNTASCTDTVHMDQTITLVVPLSRSLYPDHLRRIGIRDPETQKRLVFLTNNFDLSASTVAELYRFRWRIELFFKWIKQHLRIKAFYGTSYNAVSTQIWVAMAIYVLIAIIKRELKLEHSPYTILQILGMTLFHKEPILQVLSHYEHTTDQHLPDNQLNLFTL